MLARGGPAVGYALVIRGGKPRFLARIGETVFAAAGKKRLVGQWTHLVGMLTADKRLRLFVDGKPVASVKIPGLIDRDPAQAMEIGADDQGAVGNYRSPLGFTGIIDEVRVYHGALSDDEVQARFDDPQDALADDPRRVLDLSFGEGKQKDKIHDASGNANHGVPQRTTAAQGKLGGAMRFASRPQRSGGSFIQHHWTKDLPLLARAMVLADKSLFVFGPPDIIDEEESFRRLVSRDPKIQQRLADQEAALRGDQGAVLQVISTDDGQKLAEYALGSLPVWDGLAAAGGRLYYATTDGKVICLAKP